MSARADLTPTPLTVCSAFGAAQVKPVDRGHEAVIRRRMEELRQRAGGA